MAEPGPWRPSPHYRTSPFPCTDPTMLWTVAPACKSLCAREFLVPQSSRPAGLNTFQQVFFAGLLRAFHVPLCIKSLEWENCSFTNVLVTKFLPPSLLPPRSSPRSTSGQICSTWFESKSWCESSALFCLCFSFRDFFPFMLFILSQGHASRGKMSLLLKKKKKNVLSLSTRAGYWAFDTWLTRNQIVQKYKIHAGFPGLSIKKLGMIVMLITFWNYSSWDIFC